MIVGPNWVFIHFQKSGGTFVKYALATVLAKQALGFFYWLWPSNLNCNRLPFKHVCRFLSEMGGGKIFDGHIPYSKTPAEHKNKTMLFAYRHPFDLLVSHFYYNIDRAVRKTRRMPPDEKAEITQALPDFPNHSFGSWVRVIGNVYRDRHLRNKLGMSRDDLGMDVGFLSFSCIYMLFKDPEEILRTMNRDYFISGRYKKDMCDFVKIRTENLNEDLYHALVDLGVRLMYVRFLKTQGKKNVTKKRPGRDWRKFYDDDLLDYVLKKEWVWFQVFPEHLEQLKESFPGYVARGAATPGAE